MSNYGALMPQSGEVLPLDAEGYVEIGRCLGMALCDLYNATPKGVKGGGLNPSLR